MQRKPCYKAEVAINRRILAVVSDAHRGEELVRVLNPKGFRVSSRVRPHRLDTILREFAPRTVIVDFDPLSWAQQRDNLGAVLQDRDVVLIARNCRQHDVKFTGLSPRGIVCGLPTWDALSMWLDVPEAVDPNRRTYSEASAMH